MNISKFFIGLFLGFGMTFFPAYILLNQSIEEKELVETVIHTEEQLNVKSKEDIIGNLIKSIEPIKEYKVSEEDIYWLTLNAYYETDWMKPFDKQDMRNITKIVLNRVDSKFAGETTVKGVLTHYTLKKNKKTGRNFKVYHFSWIPKYNMFKKKGINPNKEFWKIAEEAVMDVINGDYDGEALHSVNYVASWLYFSAKNPEWASRCENISAHRPNGHQVLIAMK